MKLPALLALACLGVGACEGGSAAGPAGPEDPAATPDGSSSTSSSPATAATQPLCDLPSPGAAPLRRITVAEYSNVAEDLFQYMDGAAENLPEDNVVDGYDNNVGNASVSQLRADRFFEAAEAIAADQSNLRADLPCDAAAVDAACIDGFVATLGRRVWRRPLEAEERETLRGVFDATEGDTLDARLSAILEAMLVAPQFLFRPEVGVPAEGDATVVALTDHEVATRLAFLLWVSTPDQTLLDAADAGALSSRDQIEAHARRMVNETRGRRGLRHFVMQWIDSRALERVSRSVDLYPEFDDQLARDMREELQRFIDTVAWEQDGTIADLLSSGSAQVNASLAAIYGIDHPGDDQWLSVDLPGDERRGLLTRAGFLTGKAHAIAPAPVQRGLWVRTRLLCDDIPDPPDEIDTSPPEPSEARTNRELLAQHSSDGLCAGCHKMMDPIGFGFENYDSIGRYATEYPGGLPIDATGELSFTQDVDGPFDGALELSDRLAGSDDVADCMTTQAFRYANGRRADDADQCAVAALSAQREGSIKDLLVAVTVTDGFRFRQREMDGSP